MNISKQYEQALNNNIFMKEEQKRNQENFVRRLINAESHLANEIPDLNKMNDSREKYYSIKNNVKKFNDFGTINHLDLEFLRKRKRDKVSHLNQSQTPIKASIPQAHKVQQKRAQSTKPKSLNEAVRKKEMERIAKENFEMVKSTSVISKRQQDGDFKNHVKYRKNLQKNTGQAVINPQQIAF
ncbi:UNKNOWN [Stylonychia lemnae]|uniref:Uncharacterized protein n=1 Tax=Stylonychia lemnae TaxID=5949 RepID=A0A077ZTH4_STYLE|nr:UNKNOWN [Stylonychia lemnae]|eukprot:CDW71761.1 UNKNOWN [Stylonychia lemnae]